MGVPIKEWLYFIGDNKGKTARIENGVVKMLPGLPVPLPQSPKGWSDIEVGFATDEKYRSLNRMATIPLTFINEGAEILRHFMYFDKAFNSDLYVIALKRSMLIGKYELQYSGRLDMSKAKDNPLIGVEVPAKEGGIMGYIAANESVVYEIDSTSANPDGEKVLFDGSSFIDVFDFIYGASPSGVEFGSDFSMHNDFYAVFPFVYDTEQGVSFNLVKGSTIEPDYFSNLNDYIPNSANYLFYSAAPITVKIDGILKFFKKFATSPATFHIDLFFYTSFGRRIDIVVNTLVSSFSPYFIQIGGTPIDPSYSHGTHNLIYVNEISIDLAAEERLFLIAKRYEGGDADFTITIVGPGQPALMDPTQTIGTKLNFEVATKKLATTAIGFSPLTVWKYLIDKITEGNFTGDSSYFATHKNIKLFGGESLRNLPTATLKTSLEDFFAFYDCLKPMGLKIVDNVVYIEPLVDLYGGADEILDFGPISKLEVSYAFNALANTAKFGHSPVNTEQIAGISEFNGINTFLLPVNSLKKEMNKASKYIASVYDIETTRQNAEASLANDKNNTDNNVFVANVSENTDAVGNKLLYRKTYSDISGVVNPLDIYNIEELTPARMLRAHGPILMPILEQQGNNAIKYISSTKNGHLVTLDTELIDEWADVPYSALGNPLFHAYDVTFTAPAPDTFANQLAKINKGICKATFMDHEIFLLPIGSMTSKPASEEAQQMTMRLSTLTPLSVLNALSLRGTFSIDAMGNSIYISDLNPFHFSKVVNGLPANVNYKGIYDAPFEDRQNKNEYPRAYLQKWARTEIACLQVVTNGFGLLKVYLVNEWGEIVNNHDFELVVNPGVLLPYVLQETQIDFAAIPDGKYRFVIMDDANKLFRSEWFALAEEWADTFLFEYSDTKNKANTYFSDTFTPKIRVEANFLPLEPQSDSAEYVDDVHDSEMLNGTTWDQFTLVLGGKSIIPYQSQGIPDWMARKMNKILLLNRCFIESVHYAKAKQDNIEPIINKYMPLNVYTIDMVPATASTGLVYEGTPAPLQTSFVATVDASSFGIAGDEIIDIEVIND